MNTTQTTGFTDLHTHILPEVDDGARNLETAMNMVKQAWEDGTRILFLTPHYRGAYKKNTPQQLRERFDMFREAVRTIYPDMKLYLGQEVHYQQEAPERLYEGTILSLCDSQYALLEFRGSATRTQILNGVSETIRNGFVPILAHVERYDAFRNEFSLAYDVLEMGALIQLNADSVMGDQGWGVKWLCHRLLKRRLVQFIASDAHDPDKRRPMLRACYLRVQEKYGADYAADVFWNYAQAVVENRTM